ncbi:uncharacterized protein LOC133876423 [Alnus glutinosa]|uniref:uncharacterized protein LOC133876423 n=1 Tax=Alnus glutinosa TaxID=3517 RepID=UPI002D782C8A|nr:uncharacterized protein LOC133876423 [Alnus glutinosa]
MVEDTHKLPLTANADEIEVSQILLKLPVLFSESESRRYCFRVNWGIQRRRSNPVPKPVKAKASSPATHVSSSLTGSQKNRKRKRESGDAKDDSNVTKALDLCLKEKKHDNVAPPGIQMIGRKSVTVNKGANLTTAQGGLNNMEKSKGKVVSTASKIVTRKALDDVTNVQGSSSRNVVHDGPKHYDSLHGGI